MYLVRTSIPKKLVVSKGLTHLYGVGNTSSQKICESLGLTLGCRVRQLRRTHRRHLKSEFSGFFRPIGADLKNLEKTHCQRLINIQSYTGRRHKFGYPVRGQRTHTNARTQKKLHRRWLVQDFKKPKQAFHNKKNNAQNKNAALKAKKSKVVAKAKDKNKKVATQKVGKYKIS